MRLLLLLPLLASGCADGPPESAACTDCALADANDFRYAASLSVGSSSLRAGADATLSWAGLTRDLRGNPLDPVADLDEARLVAFRDLGEAEVVDALAHDRLGQVDVSVYVTCAPVDAACTLSAFGMFGNQVDIQDYFAEGSGTWLLALGRHGDPGADALVFLEPRDDATAERVEIDDATSALHADVDLLSLDPVVVPVAEPGLVLDWSGLTRDGRGDPLDRSTVDELWVGRFTASRAELQADAFDMEARAAESWTLDVDGADAASLADLSGKTPFFGVDHASTWAVALRCRTCSNPAPRFLGFLEAEPP